LLPRVLGGGRVVLAARGIRERVIRVVRVELVLDARLGERLIELLYFVRRDPPVLVRPDAEQRTLQRLELGDVGDGQAVVHDGYVDVLGIVQRAAQRLASAHAPPDRRDLLPGGVLV